MAARDRIRPECERRPRLLASYKNCLSCPSCLLTHSDLKEGRKEGEGGRGRSTQIQSHRVRRGGERRSEWSAAALWCLWYHCMQRNDPLQKETATQWGRRGEERY